MIYEVRNFFGKSQIESRKKTSKAFGFGKAQRTGIFDSATEKKVSRKTHVDALASHK